MLRSTFSLSSSSRSITLFCSLTTANRQNTLIAESGGDPSAVSSSYATADRCRRNVGSSTAESIKQQWVVPKFLTLHWDSKLMHTLSNSNISEEHLTVVVGGSTCVQVWLRSPLW